MVAVQDLALDAIKPGARCCDVDLAVRAYFDAHDLMLALAPPHGAHDRLRYHEGPFLDTGDETEILPGMVFTVEPGLYSPELGGFRHSDTAVVTDDGVELSRTTRAIWRASSFRSSCASAASCYKPFGKGKPPGIGFGIEAYVPYATTISWCARSATARGFPSTSLPFTKTHTLFFPVAQ